MFGSRRPYFFLLFFVVFGWLAIPSFGAEIESCTDMKKYLSKPLPAQFYTTYRDLDVAVGILKSLNNTPTDECPLWLIERTYWERATAVHKFARSINDRHSRKLWFQTALQGYREYLDWFLNLSDGQQAQLIAALISKKTTDSDFEDVRRKWLRSRPGNVVGSIGIAYEEMEDVPDLIQAYQELTEQNLDECAELFPNEIVTNWFKYLKSRPEYSNSKNDNQIRDSLSDPKVAESWELFRQFLSTYVRRNPSVKQVWEPWIQRIDKWLSA